MFNQGGFANVAISPISSFPRRRESNTDALILLNLRPSPFPSPHWGEGRVRGNRAKCQILSAFVLVNSNDSGLLLPQE